MLHCTHFLVLTQQYSATMRFLLTRKLLTELHFDMSPTTPNGGARFTKPRQDLGLQN